MAPLIYSSIEHKLDVPALALHFLNHESMQ